MSPILGIWASSVTGGVSTDTYNSISTVTVGSGGASSIDFTSIPSSYEHLQIRYTARDTASALATFFIVKINGDTTNNNYIYINYVLGTNSTVAAGAVTSGTQLYGGRTIGASANANRFSVGIMDILDYKNTNKYKVVRTLSGFSDSSNGDALFSAGAWKSTSAITSLSITPYTGSWVQHTQFALYGIKGA